MHNQNDNKPKWMNKSPQKNGHGLKHGLMMMLCCLIPILLIAGLPLFGLGGGSLSGLIFLLCPLMHIGMMFMMMKKGKHSGSCHDDKNEDLNIEVKKQY